MGSLILNWEIWATFGTGLGVGGLVLAIGKYTRFFRRRDYPVVQNEEELPWENLLEMLKAQGGDLDGLSSEALLAELLKQMPESESDRYDANWTAPPTERRRNRRRWHNPIEVVVISPYHEHPLHCVVINRSIGGLAILADINFEMDTVLRVRPVDAPAGIGYVNVCVRHTRDVSNMWIIGCQYQHDVPWNVKVWFG